MAVRALWKDPLPRSDRLALEAQREGGALSNALGLLALATKQRERLAYEPAALISPTRAGQTRECVRQPLRNGGGRPAGTTKKRGREQRTNLAQAPTAQARVLELGC